MTKLLDDARTIGEHSTRSSRPPKRSPNTTMRQVPRPAGTVSVRQTVAPTPDGTSRVDAAVSIGFAVLKGILFAVALLLLVFNFKPASAALRSLFELAPHMKQFTAGVLSVTFDEQTVTSFVPPRRSKDEPNADDAAYMAKITQIIQELPTDQYRRLMFVQQLQDLCDYEQATVEMERYVSLDNELESKRLVTLKDSPALLASIKSKLGEDERSPGRAPNGYPRYCYEMTFTQLGSDVKTALVETIGAGLANHQALK
jgi:hypothetical protein